MPKLLVATIAVAAGCLSLAGCSGGDRPETAPVRGRVTFGGKPVAGATVTFLCPGAPRIAVGTTDAMGDYQLTTFEPNDGAVVGTHVVTVKKYATDAEPNLPAVDPRAGPAAMNKAMEEEMTRLVKQQRMAEKAGSPLPAKYGNRSTSDLRREVVAGQNVIDIDLN